MNHEDPSAERERQAIALLKRVHRVGVSNFTHLDLSLLNLDAFAPGSATTTATIYGEDVTRMFTLASESMSGRDPTLSAMIFGLDLYATDGLHKRHDAVRQLTRASWDTFRQQPFTSFLRRFLVALSRCTSEWMELAPSMTMNLTEASPSLQDVYHLEFLRQKYIEPTLARPYVQIIEERCFAVDSETFSCWRMNRRMQYSSATEAPTVDFIGDLGEFFYDPVALTNQDGLGFNLHMRLEFATPLKRGDRVRFTVVRTLPVDRQKYLSAPPPWHVGTEPTVPIDLLEVEVKLSPDHPNVVLHRVDAAPAGYQFDDNAPRRQTVSDIMERGGVRHSWSHPQPQHWHGFYWQ